MKVEAIKTMQDAIRDLRETYYEAVRRELRNSPSKSYQVIAKEHGVSEGLVYQIARTSGLSRSGGNYGAAVNNNPAAGGDDARQ